MASRHGATAGDRTIEASGCKARCLRRMDEVAGLLRGRSRDAA